MSLNSFRSFLRRVFATTRTAPVRRTVLGIEVFEDRRVPACRPLIPYLMPRKQGASLGRSVGEDESLDRS